MAKKNPGKVPMASPKVDELMTGTTVFNIPFPQDLRTLKKMSPIVIKHPYSIEYLHSYGQDSPFFAGLANKKLLGTRCGRRVTVSSFRVVTHRSCNTRCCG